MSQKHITNFWIDLDDKLEAEGVSLGSFKFTGLRGEVFLKLERLPGLKVSLKVNDSYVSAGNGRHFELRGLRKDWETYSLRSEQIFDSPGGGAKVAAMRQQQNIAKVIHQTYRVDTNLPSEVIDNIAGIRGSNPDWEFRLWSDKNVLDFIYECFGYELLDKYLSINPRYGAARADLFRYLCIYKYGGVYLDVKSGCDRSLNEIIRSDDRYLLSHWIRADGSDHNEFGLHSELANIEDGEYQQWHLIAAAGHPFLESVINDVLRNIETYEENLDGVGRFATLRVTGPIAYTLAIEKLRHTRDDYRFFSAEREGLIYKKIPATWNLFRRHYSTESSPLIL